MKDALNWFEIPVRNMDVAQAFYEAILGTRLQRNELGGQTLAVFPYSQDGGVGGCLVTGPNTPKSVADGVRVYLSAGEKLDPVLSRVAAAGGKLVVPRTQLPPGMGVLAQVRDPEGNVVGLHAPA